MAPQISVCIPAYNRAKVLPALLDSILSQDYDDFEIVICEDNSPERAEIRRIVREYGVNHPEIIRYFENNKNLGYDGNLRNLIEKARGQFCLFMGNDDLMCPKALSTISSSLKKHDNIGVIVRSYASFDGSPNIINQKFIYFDSERLFSAGPDSISVAFRRSVVISGMVIHREEALRFETDIFDGSLLYQIYLVANILVQKNSIFLPKILILYRNDGIPDFGNSEKEQGIFVPKEQTPESSLHFIKGMLKIAKHVETTRYIKIYNKILRDVGNYSYPILSIHSKKPFRIFFSYYLGLAKLGLWKNIMFHIYFLLILLLGERGVDRLIRFIKKSCGHTPLIGKLYRGEPT